MGAQQQVEGQTYQAMEKCFQQGLKFVEHVTMGAQQ